MKKIALLLSLILLSSAMAFAGGNSKYEAELSKIRTVKNAQTSVINSQIKEIAVKIEELEASTTVSSSEKTRKMSEYNAQLDKLTTRKNEINKKYKADKAKLKRMYKY